MCRLENALIVDPPVPDRAFQPASLELTLDSYVLVEESRQVQTTSGWILNKIDFYEMTIPEEGVLLGSDAFVLASTVEEVHIPRDLVAQVNGKSSYARRGLVVHQTAGFIDPGFRGQITLEFSNASRNPIRLLPGMPICQLVFFQMTSPALRPYGSDGLSSRYQNQAGPTPSRLQ